MARLSVNETTTFRWSFEQDVIQYHQAGIPAIGVWRQKLSDFGRSQAVELLEEHGLKVSHLLWAGGFTGSDGRTYRDSILDAIEALETAAALKTGTLILYSGGRAGHTHNHARRLIRGALEELAPQAEEYGVTLALEPMHPGCATEWTFLTSLDETLGLLEEVGGSHSKMIFDTYHFGQEPDVIEWIARLAPWIALVQLGDARRPPEGEQNRCRLGEGVIPLPEIVAALKAAGYDGDYDVELLGEEFEPADYPAILEHAKDAFNRLVGGA
ncbi:MAG: sugar phosphate isomerase/epimerase [Pirellulales bacterium]|nr:sugar phosphate isomerase/epimerase [Pirellulales bacterium]